MNCLVNGRYRCRVYAKVLHAESEDRIGNLFGTGLRPVKIVVDDGGIRIVTVGPQE